MQKLKLIILSISLLTTSCGKPDIFYGTAVDAELKQALDISMRYLGHKDGFKHINSIDMVDSLDNCNVKLDDGSCATNGVCTKGFEGGTLTRRIKIVRSRWDAKNEYSKYALLIHEVLHCAYDIKHATTKESIMSATTPDKISKDWFISTLSKDQQNYGFSK